MQTSRTRYSLPGGGGKPPKNGLVMLTNVQWRALRRKQDRQPAGARPVPLCAARSLASPLH